MTSKRTAPRQRNQIVDLMRLLLATMVLFSHAPEIIDGNRSREPLTRFLHSRLSLGNVAVSGFFLLSGYLIVQSWLTHPHFATYLRKRVLRIVPGYLVAGLLSTLVVGLIAPGVPHFFNQLRGKFILSLVLLNPPATPGVFPGLGYGSLNGSLWTIAYEFRAYMMVVVLASLGFLRRRSMWLGLTMLFVIASASYKLEGYFDFWGESFYPLLGDPRRAIGLCAAFLTGGAFLLYKERIEFRLWAAILAFIISILSLRVVGLAQPVLVVAGGYVLFFITQTFPLYLPASRRFPDISYGVYLYGWPVEALLIWFLGAKPWLVLLISLPICFSLGWLSWHFIERPMLTFRKEGTAILPPP